MTQAIDPVLDRAGAVERLDGDQVLWAEVAVLFRDECPRLVQLIRGAIAHADAPGLHRAAHSLKGSACYLGASRTAAAALVLENNGAEGDMVSASGAFLALEKEIQQLTSALAEPVA